MALIWTTLMDAALLEAVVENPDETWDGIAAIVGNMTGLVLTKDQVGNRHRRATAKAAMATPNANALSQTREALYAAQEELEQEKMKQAAITDTIWTAVERNIAGIHIDPVFPPGPPDPAASTDAVLLNADWQTGKLIRGSYSSEIAQARVASFYDQACKIITAQPLPPATSHPLFLGDLVEGEKIFQGQSYKIDESLFRQIFRVSEMMINGIRQLLAATTFVLGEGVAGNHGDNGKDSHPETNFDNIAMEVARRMLRDENRLTFPEPITPDERHWWFNHDVRGLNWFGMHGNQIRSQPNTKATRDKLQGYFNTMGPFDYVATAHYHQALQQDIGKFTHWAAGSTEDGNTYAQEFLASGAQVGSQWLHFQTDEGVVQSHLIRLP